MGKLGISIYPERSTFEKDKAYLDLAHKYGYKRVLPVCCRSMMIKKKFFQNLKK